MRRRETSNARESACADIRTLFGRRGDRLNLYLSLGAIARHILAPTTCPFETGWTRRADARRHYIGRIGIAADSCRHLDTVGPTLRIKGQEGLTQILAATISCTAGDVRSWAGVPPPVPALNCSTTQCD